MADLHSKILDARPPLGAQILSISCSFWENLAKSYVGAPPPGSWRPLLGEILDPPLEWVIKRSQFSVMNDIMNDIANDKKGHNIANDSFASKPDGLLV